MRKSFGCPSIASVQIGAGRCLVPDIQPALGGLARDLERDGNSGRVQSELGDGRGIVLQRPLHFECLEARHEGTDRRDSSAGTVTGATICQVVPVFLSVVSPFGERSSTSSIFPVSTVKTFSFLVSGSVRSRLDSTK